jgi:hypothetical protein
MVIIQEIIPNCVSLLNLSIINASKRLLFASKHPNHQNYSSCNKTPQANPKVLGQFASQNLLGEEAPHSFAPPQSPEGYLQEPESHLQQTHKQDEVLKKL